MALEKGLIPHAELNYIYRLVEQRMGHIWLEAEPLIYV